MPPTLIPFRIKPGSYPSVESDQFNLRMRHAGDALRASGVEAIYLVHGTFVGGDALGAFAEIGRLIPAAQQQLERNIKAVTDRVVGDGGNYTAAYAECLEHGLNARGQRKISVHTFEWSSANNHIGRADGAIRLLANLMANGRMNAKRVLFWGHSHAGNVFALLSLLMSGDADARRSFFEAARAYYSWPLLGKIDLPLWRDMERWLNEASAKAPKFDFVTFGTPVRYLWRDRGYNQLLHFINHRELPRATTGSFGHLVNEVLRAAGGDYVQRIGAASADMPPPFLSWRSRMANTRLQMLLEPNASRNPLRIDLRAPRLLPQKGTTLLVDYGPAEGGPLDHMAGHAIYTRREWMLFHAEEVAARLYGMGKREAA